MGRACAPLDLEAGHQGVVQLRHRQQLALIRLHEAKDHALGQRRDIDFSLLLLLGPRLVQRRLRGLPRRWTAGRGRPRARP